MAASLEKIDKRLDRLEATPVNSHLTDFENVSVVY